MPGSVNDRTFEKATAEKVAALGSFNVSYGMYNFGRGEGIKPEGETKRRGRIFFFSRRDECSFLKTTRRLHFWPLKSNQEHHILTKKKDSKKQVYYKVIQKKSQIKTIRVAKTIKSSYFDFRKKIWPLWEKAQDVWAVHHLFIEENERKQFLLGLPGLLVAKMPKKLFLKRPSF